MPLRVRRRAFVPAVALVGLALCGAGCSGDDDGATTAGSEMGTATAAGSAPSTTFAIVEGTPLAVESIPAAVAAVEAARGGPQEYTEINVTPEVVNVFVAVEGGQEVGYVVPAGTTDAGDPGAPVAQAGEPFTLDGVDLTVPPALVQEVQDRFPGAVVVQVALFVDEQGLVWGVQHRSPLGGLFNTFYAPDGRLLGGAPVG